MVISALAEYECFLQDGWQLLKKQLAVYTCGAFYESACIRMERGKAGEANTLHNPVNKNCI